MYFYPEKICEYLQVRELPEPEGDCERENDVANVVKEVCKRISFFFFIYKKIKIKEW